MGMSKIPGPAPPEEQLPMTRIAVDSITARSTVQDIITNVLAPLKLLHLEAPFRENGINGQVFMYLTDRELKELAPKIGDRKLLLLECIAPLRKKVTEEEIAAYKAEQKKVVMKFREVPMPHCCKWANHDMAANGRGVCNGKGCCFWWYCWSCHLYSEIPCCCLSCCFESTEFTLTKAHLETFGRMYDDPCDLRTCCCNPETTVTMPMASVVTMQKYVQPGCGPCCRKAFVHVSMNSSNDWDLDAAPNKNVHAIPSEVEKVYATLRDVWESTR